MKTVLILGANSDIAEAISIKFAKEGYHLFLSGRNNTRLEGIKQDIFIRHNVDPEIFHFDALDFKFHRNFFESLPTVPDVTVCVFGYLGDQKLAESDWEESLKIIQTNYTGAVSILNIIAAAYVSKGTGCIIGVSSVAGERGRQSNYIYGSAKGGLSIYLDGLRNRLDKHGAHVLSVKPGFVATKMTEHLDLPPLLTASAMQVGNAVYSGFKSRKNSVYVLPVWRLIMIIIKLIPEAIFKKLNL